LLKEEEDTKCGASLSSSLHGLTLAKSDVDRLVKACP
jgi:hypothetical protein